MGCCMNNLFKATASGPSSYKYFKGSVDLESGHKRTHGIREVRTNFGDQVGCRVRRRKGLA